MDREWREPIAEFTASVSEGMRLCLGVAEDLKESERVGACVEDVREQLLAMVRLEREAGHLLSAMQHVVTIATGLQGEESQEEPPALLDDMECKLVSLMDEDVTFDPTTHPCVQELSDILTREKGVCEEEGEGGGDEDVQVGKVQASLKCPLTGRFLEAPVRNPQCGHVYSRAAVMRHIQHRAASASKCPVCSGCLNASDLRPEPALAEKVRRAQRRKSKRPLDSVVTL